MFNRTDIRSGMTCYTSDNSQIGNIGEVGQSHFKCDTGFLGLGKDLYIPFSAVDHTEGDKVYLNVMKDHVDQMNWDRQPVGWTR